MSVCSSKAPPPTPGRKLKPTYQAIHEKHYNKEPIDYIKGVWQDLALEMYGLTPEFVPEVHLDPELIERNSLFSMGYDSLSINPEKSLSREKIDSLSTFFSLGHELTHFAILAIEVQEKRLIRAATRISAVIISGFSDEAIRQHTAYDGDINSTRTFLITEAFSTVLKSNLLKKIGSKRPFKDYNLGLRINDSENFLYQAEAVYSAFDRRYAQNAHEIWADYMATEMFEFITKPLSEW